MCIKMKMITEQGTIVAVCEATGPLWLTGGSTLVENTSLSVVRAQGTNETIVYHKMR